MLLWSKAHLLIPASGRKRREGKLVQYPGALEALEERAVLSAVADSSVGSTPSTQDFGLPSLVDVPVSADLQVSRAIDELFGGPPPFSMIVSMPQFVTPAGTSTVTTSSTGPITFTNFEIDSDQLNQLANNITLPDGGSPYVSPYVQAISIQTTSTLDLIHFIFEPITLDLLGVNVVMSGVDMTMGFQDVSGSPSFMGDIGASAISVVSRAFDMFASGLDLVARRAQEIADSFALAADLNGVLQQFAPPAGETVPITRYEVPPTVSDSQTFTVSTARGAMVDVTATTGPSKLLGNLLAEALYLENNGYESLKALVARFLGELLPRLSIEYQREVLFNVPFEGLIPKRSVTYEAQVGTFVLTEPSSAAPLVVDIQVSSYAAPGQAGVQASVVDQSGAALGDTGTQRSPGGPLVVVPQNASTGSDGSAVAGVGGASQGGSDSGSGQQPQSTQQKKKDNNNPLLMIFPGLAPFYPPSPYGYNWYIGSRGISQGALGGARIHLKKNTKTEQNKEGKPTSWDGNPLPRVLPDLDLDDDDRDRRLSPPVGDPGEAALRGESAFWSRPRGRGFTAQILLLTSILPGIGYSIALTGQEERWGYDGLFPRPGPPLRGVEDLRIRFRAEQAEQGSHRRGWRTAIRPWSWK